MKSIIKYTITLIDSNPGFLRNICLAASLAIVIAGLWPFNFFPKNKVKWMENINGVYFYGRAIIVSTDRLQKTDELLLSDRAISLELRLKPLTEPVSLPHIVSLYGGKSPAVIAVGQWKSHLIIQSRTNDPVQFKRREPYKERGLSNVLLKNRDVFITVTSDEKGSAAYINGVPAKFYPGFQLLSEYNDKPLQIIIGNSLTGQSFWEGEFMGLAVYRKALIPEQVNENYQSWMQGDYAILKKNAGLAALYVFNERKGSIIHNHADSDYPIIIPEIFKPVERKFLESSWLEEKWNLSFIQDVTINVFGFIPFGYFVSAFLVKTKLFGSNKTFFGVIAIGFALSLCIELMQAYLPTRCSQLSDLILNTFGTAIGAFTAYKLKTVYG